MIWLTSDWHFGHDREFIWRPRGFSSVEEMNEKIVENYRKLVAPEDDVYILGDLMLGDPDVGMNCLRRLPGKLHIVRGNHDTDRRRRLYLELPNFEEMSSAFELIYCGYHLFLCHYPVLTGNFDEDKPLKARIINFCGHRHATDPFIDWDKGPIYHVEVDAHECYPVSLDKAMENLLDKYSQH